MKFIKTPLVASLFVLATSSHAATITKFGTDVSFTFDDATLFGGGFVVGNNIFFQPTNFIAESSDGAGIDTENVTLNITIEATTLGFTMDMFSLSEEGDYRLNGAAGDADVDASARFDVTSMTNVSCGGICSDSEIYSAGALADTGNVLTEWTLGGTIDLADTANWGSDTKVSVQLQNDLLAETQNVGENAFIQKKNGEIGITINTVPVPAAAWLFGSGLLGLVGVARRRK